MGYTSFQFRKLPPARLEHRDGLRHPVLFGKVTVRNVPYQPCLLICRYMVAASCTRVGLRPATVYGCGLREAKPSVRLSSGLKVTAWAANLIIT